MSNTVDAPGITAYAYWLIPAAPAHQYFRETIQRLAADYGAPIFEPHMTLAVGSDNPAEMDRALSTLRAGPLELRPTVLAFTSKFTKSLFVRFHPTPALQKLRDSLGIPLEEPFDPHVSLLYHGLPAGD